MPFKTYIWAHNRLARLYKQFVASRLSNWLKLVTQKHSVRNVQDRSPISFIRCELCTGENPKSQRSVQQWMCKHTQSRPLKPIMGTKTSRLKHASKVAGKNHSKNTPKHESVAWPFYQPSTRKPSPLPPPSSTLQTHPADPAKNRLGSNNSLRYQNYNVLPTPRLAY